MTTVWRWPIQASVGEQARVDAAGAEVGALAGREDDPRVGEQLADASRSRCGELAVLGRCAAPR